MWWHILAIGQSYGPLINNYKYTYITTKEVTEWKALHISIYKYQLDLCNC